ncbi:peroxisomal targeting signal 2 receptor isoform X2 [Thrips palmi]|uniref:Peroxin-7 n=1 Tax=Thrips palmi TaxID=161013 RepID=A0A6P8Y381_THRPL|nr:peroxisomal targeting signal 2 receptor isoform X2 [Thrips palmi]
MTSRAIDENGEFHHLFTIKTVFINRYFIVQTVLAKKAKMATFFTPERHGYAVRFSPFYKDRIAVATSQQFGLAGGGTLFVLERTPVGTLENVAVFDWSDGLFDVAWSEGNSDIAVSGSGDGYLQVWNLHHPGMPIKTFHEHTKEVYSVNWNFHNHQRILSASWDCTVKTWDLGYSMSTRTYEGHTQLVYDAVWSPGLPSTFASVAGDGMLQIWAEETSNAPRLSVKAHDAEVLSCDWCKYDQNILATGASDGLIRGWDIRRLTAPVFELRGCEYAVRRIKFSPYHASIIASASYDFTTRVWDYKTSPEAVETVKHHSEFVYGLDFNNHVPGELADCGWDSLVHIFSPASLSSVPISEPR